MLYTGCSGYCACLVYFERVERHTICKDLDIGNVSSVFEKSHYIRNGFRLQAAVDTVQVLFTLKGTLCVLKSLII